MSKTSRNSSLDLLRIFAFLCVVSVHFFLNIGFYNTPITGSEMYFMMVLRTFFMVCVPLFIMLTGYLMIDKKPSKNYYLGIKKTLLIYVAVSLLCILFKHFFLDTPYTIIGAIKSIFNFTGANYSWYIEMYIGLYLLAPFLNMIYKSAENFKHILLLSLIFLTALPPFVNGIVEIIPDWWVSIYPITYYFLGSYLREFPPKISKKLSLLLILTFALIFGTANFYIGYGELFKWTPLQDYGSLFTLILTVIVFAFFLKLNITKLKKTLAFVSDLTLCAYLVSYIFDVIIYSKVFPHLNLFENRIGYFILFVPLSAICSLLASIPITFLFKNKTKKETKELIKV